MGILELHGCPGGGLVLLKAAGRVSGNRLFLLPQNLAAYRGAGTDKLSREPLMSHSHDKLRTSVLQLPVDLSGQ
jgi:hypothetical protein